MPPEIPPHVEDAAPHVIDTVPVDPTAALAEDPVMAEALVEEVSIDGMCGVY